MAGTCRRALGTAKAALGCQVSGLRARGLFEQGTLGRRAGMTAKIERLAAKSVFDPPTYTQTMKVTGAQTILFVSGQVAYDDKGQPGHPGDFAAQARATYSALKAQVEAGGGSLANIVKLTTYLVDIRYRNDLASIREEFFGKKGPASTLVGVTALAQPGWLIEVEAIAVI
jgi:enamine deaminase RidA (YjgF/YER057c/UK114 family)